MIRARLMSVLVAAALGAAFVTGTAAAASAQPTETSVSPAAVVTLTYDASRAGTWAAAITQAVQNWNSSVHNVQLVPASSRRTANFLYVATSGWPQTTLGPIRPGGRQGEVELGQEAVAEGYDATRITAHETGHIFGLLDDYSGPCSELMSGHGPGTSCTNAMPDAAEIAQVDANYASATVAQARSPQVVVDVWRPALVGAGSR